MIRIRTLVVVSALALGGMSCGGDDDASEADGGGDDVDSGDTPDAAGPDCYDDPTTHFEIINACVGEEVQRIERDPELPLLNQDGSLPGLPPPR
jgi:hypothetical protein